MNQPPFNIIPGSIVKGSGDGYMVCQTTPTHPYAVKPKDRDCKYIYVHRVVLENHLGRLLKPGEEVDHKDKDVTHNDPSNLVLRATGEHQREHALNGNPFWEKSPKNKPKTASVMEVVGRYLRGI
jgi:hypothetical protein